MLSKQGVPRMFIKGGCASVPEGCRQIRRDLKGANTAGRKDIGEMKGAKYVQLGQGMIKGDVITVPKNVDDVNIMERENVFKTDQSSI